MSGNQQILGSTERITCCIETVYRTIDALASPREEQKMPQAPMICVDLDSSEFSDHRQCKLCVLCSSQISDSDVIM